MSEVKNNTNDKERDDDVSQGNVRRIGILILLIIILLDFQKQN